MTEPTLHPMAKVIAAKLFESPTISHELATAAARELNRLYEIINTPMYLQFLEATHREAIHQVERWGTPHDRGKEPQDWFWLVGYLSGKALRAHIDGDVAIAQHHTISSAAALLNWHAHITGYNTRFAPGLSDLEKSLARIFSEDTVR